MTSEIKFLVELDENRVPEKLMWTAQDGGVNAEEAKAMMLSIWDSKAQETLRIDLWTKEMPVDEMKHFAVDIVGNVAQLLADATGDKKLIEILESTCRSMKRHIDEEEKASSAS